MANSEKPVTETYGGKVQEQADYADKALRYRDRFSQNRDPKEQGHNMGDTDEVKGC